MLPAVFADVRGKSVMDFIEKQTIGATFCRRSDQVQEVNLIDLVRPRWSPLSPILKRRLGVLT